MKVKILHKKLDLKILFQNNSEHCFKHVKGITKFNTKEEIMFQNIGIPGLILVLMLALIIFGPSKLPELGRAFGSTLREFKKSTRDLITDDTDEMKKDLNKKEKLDK